MRAPPARSFGRRSLAAAAAGAERAARSWRPDFGKNAEPGLNAVACGTATIEARAARTAAPATAPRRYTIFASQGPFPDLQNTSPTL